jgi:anthranilate synthase component I
VNPKCPANFEEFCYAARAGNMVPLARSVPADMMTPLSAYLRISQGSKYSFLLESIEGGERIGRYSFLGAHPKAIVRGHGKTTRVTHADSSESVLQMNAAEYLRQHFQQHALAPEWSGALFFGGAVGFFGYGSASWFEPAIPAMSSVADDAIFLLLRTVVALDHARQEANIQTVVCTRHTGNTGDLEQMYAAAQTHLDDVAHTLTTPLPPEQVASAVPSGEDFQSSFSKADFESAVSEVQQLIAAGECYQAVLSQKFSRPTSVDAVALYRALRRTNPSPYNYLLQFDGHALIGSSPEMLVRSRGRQLSYRPIAGTRSRGATPDEDAQLAQDLLADEKERAEHVMLVDLGRNDLGQVAEYGSVSVERFMEVEKFSHVQHLVTHLSAHLRAGLNALDALAACFPAGTVTGAPKIRAMQAIGKLETGPRGAYSGAVLYLDYAGNMDSCIAIRTIELKDGVASVQAGAGIVADSVPQLEYEETLNKARGMQQAILMAETEDAHGAHPR